LQDPNDVLYEPLLREMTQLNVMISLGQRQDWLKVYLHQLIARCKTEKLKKAAMMALRDVTMTRERSSELRVDGRKLEEAVSLLPTELSRVVPF